MKGSIEWGSVPYKDQPGYNANFQTFSVRCVRNLGLDNPSSFTFSEGGYNYQDYIEPETEGTGNDAVYTFNATHLNEGALRYYTSRELDYHSNTSDINRLYKRFEVLPKSKITKNLDTNTKFEDVNTAVTKAISGGENNPYCPEGYRLPNQVEMTIMYYYNVLDASMFSRTYWNLGVDGYGDDGKDGAKKYGFIYDGGVISLQVGGANSSKFRCVRDIRTD